MEKKTLALIALSGVLAFGVLFGAKTIENSSLFNASKGTGSNEYSLTFNGSAKQISEGRYSVEAKSTNGVRQGRSFYLISYASDYSCASNSVISFSENSDTNFYISDYPTGKDSSGNDSYTKFENLASMTFSISGSTNVYYYLSNTTSFPSSYTGDQNIKPASPTITFSDSFHYIKLYGKGFLAQRTVSSLTLNYICGGVEPVGPTLESISLGGSYSTEFTLGDSFNHNGMTVTAHYDDESQEDVTSLATWSSPDMSSLGTKSVNVSYKGKEQQYNITVVNGASTETAHFVGDSGGSFKYRIEVVMNNYGPSSKSGTGSYTYRNTYTVEFDWTTSNFTNYTFTASVNYDSKVLTSFSMNSLFTTSDYENESVVITGSSMSIICVFETDKSQTKPIDNFVKQ